VYLPGKKEKKEMEREGSDSRMGKKQSSEKIVWWRKVKGKSSRWHKVGTQPSPGPGKGGKGEIPSFVTSTVFVSQGGKTDAGGKPRYQRGRRSHLEWNH